jgi:hypothetical protein
MRFGRLSFAVAAVLALGSVASNAAVVLNGTATPNGSGYAEISYDTHDIASGLRVQPGQTQRIRIDVLGGLISSAEGNTASFHRTDDFQNYFDGVQNIVIDFSNDFPASGSCTHAGGATTCDNMGIIPQSLRVLNSGLSAIFDYSLPTNDPRCPAFQGGCYAEYDWSAYGALTVNAKSVAPLAYRVSVSNFSAAVPEPASWAMMIAGFGMVGAVSRKRRRSMRGMGWA